MNVLASVCLASCLALYGGEVAAPRPLSNASLKMTQADSVASRLKKAEWVAQNAQQRLSIDRALYIVNHAVKEGEQNDIDPVLVLAVMKVESGFNPRAVSSAGAIGMMQVIPRWHPEEVQGKNLKRVDHGIQIGTAVLRKYIDEKDGNIKKALTRYNGGGRSYAALVLSTKAKIIRETS